MTERIRELAEQVYGSAHYDDFKFAELIVRECAFYLENEYGKSVITGNDAADFIRKHFGVENA